MTDLVLPENARFIGDDITEGDFKVAFVEMLDYLREQFGDNGAISDLINNLAAVAKSGSYNDLKNKPNLAAVATSGSYNDLANKPSIPTNYVAKDNGSLNVGSYGWMRMEGNRSSAYTGRWAVANANTVGGGSIRSNGGAQPPGTWRNVSGHEVYFYSYRTNQLEWGSVDVQGLFQRIA